MYFLSVFHLSNTFDMVENYSNFLRLHVKQMWFTCDLHMSSWLLLKRILLFFFNCKNFFTKFICVSWMYCALFSILMQYSCSYHIIAYYLFIWFQAFGSSEPFWKKIVWLSMLPQMCNLLLILPRINSNLKPSKLFTWINLKPADKIKKNF